MSKLQNLINRLEDRRVCSLAHNSCYNDFTMQEAARALAAQAAEIERLQAELAMSKADERWQAVADEVGHKLLALEAERDALRVETRVQHRLLRGIVDWTDRHGKEPDWLADARAALGGQP